MLSYIKFSRWPQKEIDLDTKISKRVMISCQHHDNIIPIILDENSYGMAGTNKRSKIAYGCKTRTGR